MRKPTCILGAAAMIALGMGFSHPVEASTHATAAGAITVLSDTLTTIGSVGSDKFIDEVEPETYHGGIAGTVIDTDTYIQHRDGSYSGQGTEVCASCSIGGKKGTYTAMFTFAGSGSKWTGTMLFIHASGGLTGLHGGGTFGSNGSRTSYAYTYSFSHTS